MALIGILILVGYSVLYEQGIQIAPIGNQDDLDYPVERQIAELSEQDLAMCGHGDGDGFASFRCDTTLFGNCRWIDIFNKPDPTTMKCEF